MDLHTDLWPVPPLFEGAWRNLDSSHAAALNERLIQTPERCGALSSNGPMIGFRILPLQCYDGWLSIEALIARPGGDRAVGWMLYGPWGPFTLEGSSLPFHEANDLGALTILSEASAAEYLRLFTSAVHGSDGPFMIVESDKCLFELTGVRPPDDKVALLRPLQIQPGAEGGWSAQVSILYGGAVFEATFVISPDGIFEMTSDELLFETDAGLSCVFSGPLREAKQTAQGSHQ